ncbi:MAG: hypothetical protein H6832_15860 [Planctomycetes bacterium]|nr:hypothetical protein [Planctomycetota bacterium]MCB9919878.1 hypothetical protein [Planctomycetota bacterium]
MNELLAAAIRLAPEIDMLAVSLFAGLASVLWKNRQATRVRIGLTIGVVVVLSCIGELSTYWLEGGTFFEGGNPVLPEMVALAVATVWILWSSKEAKTSNALPMMLAIVGIALVTYRVFDNPRAFDAGIVQSLFADEDGEGRLMRIDAFTTYCRLLIVSSCVLSVLVEFAGPVVARASRSLEESTRVHLGSLARILFAHAAAMTIVATEHAVVAGSAVIALGLSSRSPGRVALALHVVASAVVVFAVAGLADFAEAYNYDEIAFAWDRAALAGELPAIVEVSIAAGGVGVAWLTLFGSRWLRVRDGQRGLIGLAMFLSPIVFSGVTLRVALSMSGTVVVAPFAHEAFCFGAAGALVVASGLFVSSIRSVAPNRQGAVWFARKMLCVGLVCIAMSGFFEFSLSSDGTIESSHARDAATIAVLVQLVAWVVAVGGLLLCSEQNAPMTTLRRRVVVILSASIGALPPSVGFVALAGIARLGIGSEIPFWLVGLAALALALSCFAAFESTGRTTPEASNRGRSTEIATTGFAAVLAIASVTLFFAPDVIVAFAKTAAFGLRL